LNLQQSVAVNPTGSVDLIEDEYYLTVWFKNIEMTYNKYFHGIEVDEHISIFKSRISKCNDLDCLNETYTQHKHAKWVPDSFMYYKQFTIPGQTQRRFIRGIVRDSLEAAIQDMVNFESAVKKLLKITEKALESLQIELFNKGNFQKRRHDRKTKDIWNEKVSSSIETQNIRVSDNLTRSDSNIQSYEENVGSEIGSDVWQEPSELLDPASTKSDEEVPYTRYLEDLWDDPIVNDEFPVMGDLLKDSESYLDSVDSFKII
jgi:hypothetical protein